MVRVITLIFVQDVDASALKVVEKIGLHIIVVGAGLAGISAAISCALAGHSVTVLESAKELAEVFSRPPLHFGSHDDISLSRLVQAFKSPLMARAFSKLGMFLKLCGTRQLSQHS